MAVRRVRALVALAATAGLVGACDGGPSRQEAEARRQRAVWDDFEPAVYEMTWTRMCSCGLSGVPLRVTVSHGDVIAVQGEGVTPEAVANQAFRSQFTVERAFDHIDDALEHDWDLEVDYSPDGWPRRVHTNEPDASDSDTTITIADLRPLPA